MNFKVNISTIYLFLLVFLSTQIKAQEIGIGWEFSEDGNLDGWSTSSGLDSISILNGKFTAKVVGQFPSLRSEEFEIVASENSYFSVRMKLPRAKTAKVMWNNDSGEWGFYNFPVFGDSSFHIYDLPLYTSEKWVGNITKITSLQSNPTKNEKIEIDYIRIWNPGFNPRIETFKPFNTVLKQNEEYKFGAIIKNNGDKSGNVEIKIVPPNNFQFSKGVEKTNIHLSPLGDTDTLYWNVTGNTLGVNKFGLELYVDDVKKASANFDDQMFAKWWVQDRFYLNDWWPPEASENAYKVFTDSLKFSFRLYVWPWEMNYVDPIGIDYNAYLDGIVSFEARSGSGNFGREGQIDIPQLTDDDWSNLETFVNEMKEKPQVIGYFIIDEPSQNAFPNLGNIIKYLHKNDPGKPGFIDLFPNYAGIGDYEKYVKECMDIVRPELITYNHYHFHNGGGDGSRYFENMEVIKKYADLYEIPFIASPQAMGTDGTPFPDLNWRIPSNEEHRWLAYSSITYGAKGLIWFYIGASPEYRATDWGAAASPDSTRLIASIAQLNKEINNLGDILINLNSEGVYHYPNVPNGGKFLPSNKIVKEISDGSDLLIGIFKHQDGDDYLMLMNKDYSESTTATIQFNYVLDGFEVFDADKNIWEAQLYDNSSGSSSFEFTFEPGDGKLFKLSGETLVGVTEVNEFPTIFSLNQNYPNPFNPSTTIKYSIPNVGNGNIRSVQLKVYDVLGREIATLVNKEQKPGNYQVVWDASKLSSGIYFYRLKTQEFLQTKKMMYLK